MVACLPLLREWRTATTLVPLMPCASTGIYFRSILASSRLSFEWWFRRACAGLLLPRPLGACRSPSPTFHRLISPRCGCVKLKESSLAIFLEVMTRCGFLSMPGHGHCRPCRASPLWAILRSTGGAGLHSSESIKIERRSVFLFLLPRSRLAGSCFRSVGLFSSWLEWWLPLVSRSRSCLLRSVGSPRFKSLGCRATWSPWLLVSRAIASVTFRLCAATTAAPVHHTLRQPCFSSRKLRLHGCRWCLRLLILSWRSPLGRSPCSVSLFGPVSF